VPVSFILLDRTVSFLHDDVDEEKKGGYRPEFIKFKYFYSMILVTGGTGMLGAHLLFTLAKKAEKVKAIYRTEKSLEKVKKVFSYYTEDAKALYSKIEWIQATLSDIPALEGAFQGVKTVYHAAALVSFDKKDYKEMRTVNIEGTANIVNLCIAFKVQKLAFVSSIAAIEKSIAKPLIDEKDSFDVETSNYGYAITKHGAEMEVWRGAQEGLDVFVVNPGIILGPGFWQENSGKLFAMVAKETPFYTSGVTGFIGVADVVKFLIQGMTSEVKNERFVLVSENKSFKEILETIAANFQKRKPFVRVTKPLGALGWRLSWLKSRLTSSAHAFTKHNAKAIDKHSFYDNSKAKRFLQFDFEPMTDVIGKVCEQYLQDKN
jgi:dihydroflavonol-4-reductase